MPFAEYQRVVYRKNPLVEVVCQLRFPRILKINEKQPADFQERIRESYPLFQVAVDQQQQISVEIGEAAQLSPRILPLEVTNNYCFSSVDEKQRVNLTSTFLALSTRSYDRWENFVEKLEEPLAALIDIYKPPFFERIGLRYIDAFKRSNFGLDDVAWTELLNPFVLGFISNQEIQQDVKTQNTQVELDIGGGAMAQIRAGLGVVLYPNTTFPARGSEDTFIVDSDMYVPRRQLAEVGSTLEYLHGNSTKLIRSIITSKLHDAMEPEVI